MNKDRGTIKWNAMMLPEHVKMLRDWQAEDAYVTKPEVDEWEMQRISEQLQLAYERDIMIELTIWEPTVIYKVHHCIQNIHVQKQVITLKNGQKIPFSSICDAVLDS